MRGVRAITGAVLLTLLFTSAAQAASITVQLVQTVAGFTFNPPGAPAPLGTTQYDSGVVFFNGQQLGQYLRVKSANGAGFNVAAVSLTIFLNIAAGAPTTVTLLGGHDVATGNQSGSVSASSVAGVTGGVWTYIGATGALTVQF